DNAFWDAIPDDCAGGYLWPDGSAPCPDDRILPLDRPCYVTGRPACDDGVFKVHVFHACGVPVVSDSVLAALRALGAQGDTAPITYRGVNKAAYDTVQPGYQRFLVRPEYVTPYHSTFEIEFLPIGIPEQF